MDKTTPTWFLLCEHDVMGLLRRAAEGQHPQLLMVELLANSEDISGRDEPPILGRPDGS